MANKRIRDLSERTTFSSGDYLATDNSSGTRKVDASKILTPISTAQSTADLVTSRVSNSGDAFSSSKGYDVGDLVVAPTDNLIYRCKTAYSTGASWNSRKANFEQISVVKAVDTLNAALLNYCKFKHLYSGTSNIYSKTIDLSEYDAVMLGVGYGGRVYATSIINKGATGSIVIYMGWDASNRFVGGADFTISDNGIAVGSARYSLINASGSSNFTETTNTKIAIYEIYGIKY